MRAPLKVIWTRLGRPLLHLLWLAALPCAHLRAEEGRPLLTSFPPRDTGSAGSCWTTTQDDRGVLYFGCDVVLSFDGEHWRPYEVPGGHEIRGLASDPQGRLWVAATNEIGYFERTPLGTLSPYHSLLAQLPADRRLLGDVWHVFAHHDGAVFVTTDSILVWDGRNLQIHPLTGSRRIVARQVDGEIYAGTLKKGVWRLGPDRLEPFLSPATLHDAGVAWQQKTPQGWLLVTTAGLATYEHGQLHPIPGASAEFIRQNVLTSVCQLTNGDLCLATLGSGLAIVAPTGQLKRLITVDDGLPAATIYSVFTARDGSLWITSQLGLARLVLDQGVTLYDTLRGLTGKPCTALAQAGSRIVVATSEALYQLPLDHGPGERFARVPHSPASALSLAGDDDSLYIGLYKGIYRLRAGDPTRVFTSENDIIRLQASRVTPGALLAANNYELVKLLPTPDGQLTAQSLAHFPEVPNSIAEDPGGHLWVGTRSHGVSRLRDQPGSPPIAYRPLHQSPLNNPGLVGRLGDTIVIATDRTITLRPATGAPSLTLTDVPPTEARHLSNEDPHGHLWIAYDSPFPDRPRVPLIGRLTRLAGQTTWQLYAVPGLAEIGDLHALLTDTHDDLWIGGTEGLLRLDPHQLRPLNPPAAPLIQASLPSGGKLDYDHNDITFDFATLAYLRRETLRFQTRLGGERAPWSPPTNNPHLALAGLRDGDYEFAVRLIDEAGQTGPPAIWRFEVLAPWYRTNLALAGWLLLLSGGVIGFVQWRSDYLRRRNARLEALVAKKTEQLAQANAAKSEFISSMSHEIRNPISGIVGLSLAIEETPLNERQRTLAHSIRSCASLLATLVDDVLDFSKIEAGKFDLRPEPFDPRANLAQCVDMVREDLRSRGNRIDLTVAPAVPALLLGDAPRVQQIVLNYLTNAAKFGAGQPVALTAEMTPTHTLRLTVSDRGPGMTQTEAASLFTKFTRLERARSEKIRGTGLGLAVCRTLAEKMGGTVGVISAPGQGSQFWVELPLPAAEAGPRPLPNLPAGPALRALIVEDIEYNAIAMQAVLRKLGVESDVAADGPTALAQLQRTFYDVAFMDWNLPGMIGTEVVTRYRAIEPPQQRTVIIATTAYSADFNRQACLEAGMDAFIAKPFTPGKIAAALQDLRGSLRAAASVEVRELREAAPPVADYDLQMLEILAEGSPEGLAGQIQRYFEAIEADRLALVESIRAGAPKQIHRHAHRLASHASMIKYDPLIQLAAELQAQSATTETGRLERLRADFDRELTRLKGRLAAKATSMRSA